MIFFSAILLRTFVIFSNTNFAHTFRHYSSFSFYCFINVPLLKLTFVMMFLFQIARFNWVLFNFNFWLRKRKKREFGKTWSEILNSMPFQLLPEVSFVICVVWDVLFHLVAASFQDFSKINDGSNCFEQLADRSGSNSTNTGISGDEGRRRRRHHCRGIRVYIKFTEIKYFRICLR